MTKNIFNWPFAFFTWIISWPIAALGNPFDPNSNSGRAVQWFCGTGAYYSDAGEKLFLALVGIVLAFLALGACVLLLLRFLQGLTWAICFIAHFIKYRNTCFYCRNGFYKWCEKIFE